jgi:deoxyribodipyrimidine photo-lyase
MTTSNSPIIVWFRRDLRLADNPALSAALATGRPVVPLYIWAPEEEAPWAPGAASRWWLHHSLLALETSLRKAGAELVLRQGGSLDTLRAVMRETAATEVYWNRLYEPAVIARDKTIKAALAAKTFNANLLHEPWTIATQQEKPYQVFTPFYKACQFHGDPGRPLPAAQKVPTLGKRPFSDFQPLELLPRLNWADGFSAHWTPGEAGAAAKLAAFEVESYSTERDRPDHEGTSRLSPHLHFGEVSPRQIWWAIRDSKRPNPETYLRQLIWREFAHHLLYHFPHTPTEPLRSEFRAFPWADNPAHLKAWQRGRTGYPIVDAGMNELWATGWMHNRVRMIVASFLVKDLMLPWQAGAAWFWDTLVDADLANNTLGWQWTAGCGADAAPYFRVFNPGLQAAKFDPDGVYQKQWAATSPCPPIVDHATARDEALAAYAELKRHRVD